MAAWLARRGVAERLHRVVTRQGQVLSWTGAMRRVAPEPTVTSPSPATIKPKRAVDDAKETSIT